MYPDYNNPGVGVFGIDWNSLSIELKGKRISLGSFYLNLIHKEDYPEF